MNDQSLQPDKFDLPAPVAEPPQLPPMEAPDTKQPQAAAPSGPVPATQDSDTIEPEWVNKVEQTMRQSINDPYQLSQQLSQLKESYIAGRYGMTLNPKNQDK